MFRTTTARGSSLRPRLWAAATLSCLTAAGTAPAQEVETGAEPAGPSWLGTEMAREVGTRVASAAFERDHTIRGTAPALPHLEPSPDAP